MVCESDLIDPAMYVVIKKTASQTHAKCKSCHSLSVRVSKALAKRSDLKDEWVTMTKDEKKQFYLANAGAMSLDIPTAIKEGLRHSYQESSSQSFSSNGTWLDKEDLEERFASKPQQLQSVLANAKQIWCPIRNCSLYELLEYKSNTLDEKAAEKSRLLQCEQEGNSKAAKGAPKPKGAAKAKSAGIIAAAKKKIEKLLSTAKEMCGRLDNQADDEEREALIPEQLVAAVTLARAELSAKVTEAEHALEHGGNGSEIVHSLQGALRSAKTASEKVSMIIKAMAD
jgi:hypothetical protein